MRDYYSSCDTSGYPSSVHYLSQFLSNHSNHPGDLSVDADALRREPRERRSALVVDDVADVTEMLAVVLTHAGYSVVTAASAPDALKAARERQFDVIISDIGMPEMDGFELRRLALAERPELPVILVTGRPELRAQDSSNIEPDRYFEKPFDGRQLLAAVRAALGSARPKGEA